MNCGGKARAAVFKTNCRDGKRSPGLIFDFPYF